MSTTSRRESTPVINILSGAPYNYSFTQAVRLLERAVVYNHKKESIPDTTPITGQLSDSFKSIRFSAHQSLSFQSSDIKRLNEKQTSTGSRRWDMLVNFMGLTGANSVLPYHYTELLLKRKKLRDQALIDFLDLFNHRIIALFYKAATKYNLPISYERTKLMSPSRCSKDHSTQALLSLVGLGNASLQNRLYTRDESLLYYAGLFTQSIRNTHSLQRMLQEYFSIPVEIQEFIGQWQELIDDVRTRLPGKNSANGQNNRLGKSAMLGRKGWFAQGKIRIQLGPLTNSQMMKFAPATASLVAINEIVRLYIGMEYEYDFVLRVKRSDIPETIKMDNNNPPILGWNSWIGNIKQRFSDEATIDINVSSHRLG